MTKICPRCGTVNEEESVTCRSCGASLNGLADRTIRLPFGEEEAEAFPSEKTGLPELAPVKQPHLVVLKGPNPGVRFLLGAESVVIGRDPDSDIFLNDVTVSRQHANIERKAGKLTIRDVGSLNGTYVNGKRVDAAELSDGDEVQIGKYKMVLFLGNTDE